MPAFEQYVKARFLDKAVSIAFTNGQTISATIKKVRFDSIDFETETDQATARLSKILFISENKEVSK